MTIVRQCPNTINTKEYNYSPTVLSVSYIYLSHFLSIGAGDGHGGNSTLGEMRYAWVELFNKCILAW